MKYVKTERIAYLEKCVKACEAELQVQRNLLRDAIAADHAHIIKVGDRVVHRRRTYEVTLVAASWEELVVYGRLVRLDGTLGVQRSLWDRWTKL